MFMSHGPSVEPAQRDILHDYKAADAYLTELGKGEQQFGRQSGSIGRRGSGAIAIRYHNTDVYTLHDNGDTSFRTDGWFTNSTQAWMSANSNFSVSLYEPRSGERKPFRYSMIRFKAHDRNIEQKLRDEMGMPSFAECRYISTWEFETWDQTADGGIVTIVTDEHAHSRASAFQDELAKRKIARHPYYVFVDGITFTKRGRCVEGTRLSDAIDAERKERDKIKAERRRRRGCIKRFVNRTMEALDGEGLRIDGETPDGRTQLLAAICSNDAHGPIAMRIISATCPGDIRDWLNLHDRDGEIVAGNLAPVIEPIVRERLTERLTRELLPAL